MKAVFKGYLVNSKISKSVVNFTIGNTYELIPDEVFEGFYQVKDDEGFTHLIRPDKLGYHFDVIIPDEVISYSSKAMIDKILSKPPVDQRKFTYYINGMSVTKERFDSALSCVKDFEAEGVNASSIKFELKFE